MAVALNYGDCILYNSDLLILSSRGWLNDRLISFAFEYFQKSKFPILLHLQHNVHFFPAEVTQLVKFLSAKELLETVLIPRGITGASARHGCALLFPVNNNSDPEAQGGSHWSLLLYSWSHNVAFHYNSAQGGAGQLECAKLITENLDSAFSLADDAASRQRRQSMEGMQSRPAMNKRRQSVDVVSPHQRHVCSHTGGNTTVTDVRDCPQQENSSDCGLFVIAYAEYLAQQIISQYGFRPAELMSVKVRDLEFSDMSQLRNRLLQIILELQKKGENGTVAKNVNVDEQLSSPIRHHCRDILESSD